MKRGIILLIILASCAYNPEGVRYVIDGDTFVLNNGEKVRLLGIDAPERGDANYNRAAYELQRLIAGRELILEGTERDRYGRLLKHVFADGEHVNVELVREGWARAYLHEGTQYEETLNLAQSEARAENKGIWNIDERQYVRLSHRCIDLECPSGTVAVASINGDVFYNCGCGSAFRIQKENIICFETVQDAVALGLRETKRC